MSRNRPLSRSLIKIAVRIAAGGSRAHAQDWFPGLKLTRATPSQPGSIIYRGRQVGTLVHSTSAVTTGRDAIFVVGSGPSVAATDLTRTGEKTCLLLNGALTLLPNTITAPLAIAVEDERFVWRHFDLMQRVPADCPCLLSVSALRAICEIEPGWLRARPVVLIDDIRKPYGVPRRNEEALRALPFAVFSPESDAGFSTDPDAGVFQGGSVAITAAQFAIAWAPRTLGFVGIDIANANDPRFYEGSDTAYSGLVKGQTRILDHLALAKTVAEQRGIEVQNHSKVSALASSGFAYSDMLARRDD